MNQYLTLPHFDPTIFTLGDSNIGLRWYGLMYLLGFIFARWLAVRRASRSNSGWTVDQVDTLLFNGFMGVFIGGRVGDVFLTRATLFVPCLGRWNVFPWRINRRHCCHDLDVLFTKT